MNSRVDLANGPEFSDSFSKVSVQQYIWQSLRNGRASGEFISDEHYI